MDGDRERAELAAFEALLANCIADALVAEVGKEAEYGEMSEWLKEHAWKLIPLARAEAHQNPPTQLPATTSGTINVRRRVSVNDGV